MTVCVDKGNTRVKCGLFKGGALDSVHTYTLPRQQAGFNAFMKSHANDNYIISDVSTKKTGKNSLALRINSIEKHISLTKLLLPVTIGYRTPATLGADRLALACGARVLYPKNPVLVVSAGTCITYEYISVRGEYAGGAIAPGLHMRLEAMHHFTAGLPLIKKWPTHIELIGRSTQDAMLSGAINGAVAETEQNIVLYSNKYKNLIVIVTGGDTAYLQARLKSKIFALPHLALIGLNNILQLNAEKTFSH